MIPVIAGEAEASVILVVLPLVGGNIARDMAGRNLGTEASRENEAFLTESARGCSHLTPRCPPFCKTVGGKEHSATYRRRPSIPEAPSITVGVVEGRAAYWQERRKKDGEREVEGKGRLL